MAVTGEFPADRREMADVLRNTIMITGFVFVMMLVIEFLNVLTSGGWQNRLVRSRIGQYLLAAILGAVPGCLGAFAVVAMYSHRLLSLGAVVTAMIATSGDEAFVMLAMIPKQAVILTGLLFLIGIAAGILTDLVARNFKGADTLCCDEMIVHEEHLGQYLVRGKVIEQWRRCTAARGILTIMLVALIIGLVSGQIGHGEHGHLHDTAEQSSPEVPGSVIVEQGGEEPQHPDEEDGWGWVRITMLVSSLAALFIVATVSDHFLDEHLWEHIARKHLFRIFAWTFSALLVLYLITDYLHIDLATLAGEGKWILLVIACLVGLIPQSGPHLVFVTLFARGFVPFSILMASSIVQDGHGMLPMLAQSRRGFLVIKAINLAAGLLVGAAALLSGF